MAKKENPYFKLLRKACVKCGFIPFNGQTQYVEYQSIETHSGPTNEIIKLTCQRCGYSWEIDTLDKNSPPPLPDPPEPSYAIRGNN